MSRAIRSRRKQLEMTQAELAELTGVSPTTVQMIEAGSRGFSWQLLDRMSEAMGISVSDLVRMGE